MNSENWLIVTKAVIIFGSQVECSLFYIFIMRLLTAKEAVSSFNEAFLSLLKSCKKKTNLIKRVRLLIRYKMVFILKSFLFISMSMRSKIPGSVRVNNKIFSYDISWSVFEQGLLPSLFSNSTLFQTFLVNFCHSYWGPKWVCASKLMGQGRIILEFPFLLFFLFLFLCIFYNVHNI